MRVYERLNCCFCICNYQIKHKSCDRMNERTARTGAGSNITRLKLHQKCRCPNWSRKIESQRAHETNPARSSLTQFVWILLHLIGSKYNDRDIFGCVRGPKKGEKERANTKKKCFGWLFCCLLLCVYVPLNPKPDKRRRKKVGRGEGLFGKLSI